MKKYIYILPVYLLCNLAGLTPYALGQECSMTGKQIQWRIRVCSDNRQLGCSRIRTKSVFLVKTLVEYEDNPNFGIVFEIGRTVNITDNDLPYLKQTVNQNNFASARASLSATFNNGTLLQSQDLKFFNSYGKLAASMFLSYKFQIYNCSSCKVLTYESRARGAAGEDVTKMVQEISCEITTVNSQ